jgi:hypothetical protein
LPAVPVCQYIIRLWPDCSFCGRPPVDPIMSEFRAERKLMFKLKTQCAAVALVAGMLVGAAGCKHRQDDADLDESADASQPLLSAFRVAQPRAQRQLVTGFWGVENHAWRWTRHEFAVTLMPPPGASQKGATLEFRFSVPDSLIEKKQALTLTASIGGVVLLPDTYSQGGSFVYLRDVPAAALKENTPATIAFRTDKFYGAGEVDGRELALVASSFGLVSK